MERGEWEEACDLLRELVELQEAEGADAAALLWSLRQLRDAARGTHEAHERWAKTKLKLVATGEGTGGGSDGDGDGDGDGVCSDADG